MDWPTIILTGVSIVIGGFINWYFSRRSSRELRRETSNLRQLNGLTIRILDEAKMLPDNVEPTKDEAGNYTGGLTHKLKGTARAGASARGTLKVTRSDQETTTREGGS